MIVEVYSYSETAWKITGNNYFSMKMYLGLDFTGSSRYPITLIHGGNKDTNSVKWLKTN